MDTHTLKEKGLLGLVILLVVIAILLIINYFVSSSPLEEQVRETGVLFDSTAQTERYALDGNVLRTEKESITLLIEGEEHAVSPIPELYTYSEGDYVRVGTPFLYNNITASVWFVIPAEGESYIERVVVFP